MVSEIRHTVYVISLLFGVAVHHHHYVVAAEDRYMAVFHGTNKKPSKTFRSFLSVEFKRSGILISSNY